MPSICAQLRRALATPLGSRHSALALLLRLRDAINQPLSERRALSVANALIRNGVMPERLYIEGRSSTQPVASNDTAQGRAQNRRVEILIRPFRG